MCASMLRRVCVCTCSERRRVSGRMEGETDASGEARDERERTFHRIIVRHRHVQNLKDAQHGQKINAPFAVTFAEIWRRAILAPPDLLLHPFSCPPSSLASLPFPPSPIHLRHTTSTKRNKKGGKCLHRRPSEIDSRSFDTASRNQEQFPCASIQ